MKKNAIILLSIASLALVLLAACGNTSNTSTSAQTAVTASGQTLMQERCSVCHSTDRITQAHKTADQWKTNVERMVGKGARLNAQEQQVLIDYLTQTYP